MSEQKFHSENQPLLSVESLRKEYHSQAGLLSQLLGKEQKVVRAVDGVSFQLMRGEILGLVGESGSGKTTIGRMISMLEPPTSGTIRFNGTDITGLDHHHEQELRREVQMVFQNPYEAIDPRNSVGSWVAKPLEFLGIGNKAERQTKVEEVLAAVGLRPPSAYVNRLSHELSGGQRQRVDIARAIVVEPKLLIADEPVSMLDVSVRSGILKLLLQLRDRVGVSYIFISHDLALARYVSDRIAVLFWGKVMEIGPTDSVIQHPGHPYTKILLSAVPDPNPLRKRERIQPGRELASAGEPPSGCRFRNRCPIAEDICAEEEPPLVAIGSNQFAACHFAEQVVDHG